MTIARLGHAARECLLTVGAVVGACCLVLTALGYGLDVRPLIFRSGSMSPAIETGDLALARTVDADRLHRDDIVSVSTADGDRVTHRVVTNEEQGSAWLLTLKGDANQLPDAEVYSVSQVDRVMVVVPTAGYVVDWLSSPIGLMALGGYGVFLASVLLRPGRRDRRPPSARHGARPGAGSTPTQSESHEPGVLRSLGASTLAALVAWAAASGATPTGAEWADGVPVSNTTFSAYTVPPTPTFTCGTVGNRRVTFNWSAVPVATSYVFHYGTGGAQTQELTTTTVTLTAPGGTTSGTAWIDVKRNFGSVSWTSVASVKRTYTLAQTSTCR
ncbi:MAG: signal peptidase I [Nocardioides sp.]